MMIYMVLTVWVWTFLLKCDTCMGNCGSILKDDNERKQRFMSLNINMIREDSWREKVCNYTAFYANISVVLFSRSGKIFLSYWTVCFGFSLSGCTYCWLWRILQWMFQQTWMLAVGSPSLQTRFLWKCQEHRVCMIWFHLGVYIIICGFYFK